MGRTCCASLGPSFMVCRYWAFTIITPSWEYHLVLKMIQSTNVVPFLPCWIFRSKSYPLDQDELGRGVSRGVQAQRKDGKWFHKRVVLMSITRKRGASLLKRTVVRSQQGVVKNWVNFWACWQLKTVCDITYVFKNEELSKVAFSKFMLRIGINWELSVRLKSDIDLLSYLKGFFCVSCQHSTSWHPGP